MLFIFSSVALLKFFLVLVRKLSTLESFWFTFWHSKWPAKWATWNFFAIFVTSGISYHSILTRFEYVPGRSLKSESVKIKFVYCLIYHPYPGKQKGACFSGKSPSDRNETLLSCVVFNYSAYHLGTVDHLLFLHNRILMIFELSHYRRPRLPFVAKVLYINNGAVSC